MLFGLPHCALLKYHDLRPQFIDKRVFINKWKIIESDLSRFIVRASGATTQAY